MPPSVSRLELLQVLLVSNNKLVSLPEEIGRLKHLQQLVEMGGLLYFMILLLFLRYLSSDDWLKDNSDDCLAPGNVPQS